MTRAEAPPPSLLTLRRLPRGYRVLYTGVLAFFVLGYGAGLVQQHVRAGLTPTGAAQWILGNEDDPEADRFLFSMSGEEVLDQAWRRSLADVIPVIVTLALLLRSGVPPAAKGALAGTLLVGALADTAGPWLVHAGGAAWGLVWWGAQIALAGGAAGVAVLCIGEMWLLGGRGRRTRRAHVPGGAQA